MRRLVTSSTTYLLLATILLITDITSGQYNYGSPYDIGYDNRNQINNPNHPHINPKTPVDQIKRYYHSDSRCLEDLLTYNYDEIITVSTRHGKLTGMFQETLLTLTNIHVVLMTGRIAYLCDGPGVPERDRPVNAQHQNQDYISSGYRPRARIKGNVTLFLGVPYAKPPTRENNLRFKVTNA